MAINKIGYDNREELIKEIQLRLADGMVDVELDREHYDVAINKALQKYRQLSSGAVEESMIFIVEASALTVVEVQTLIRLMLHLITCT